MTLDQIGHYRIVSRLGSGGMGVVHLAYSSSGRKVALKVVHAHIAEDQEFRARFRQEVTAARRVSGAFTAAVVDADPEAERPWMATQHIAGPTLSQYVKREGPLPADDLRWLAAGLAEALRDIHRAGLVHRDLKPSNVLLAADGPKVIDFGISRPSDSEMRTETGKLIGTPPFMAPEQFQRPRSVGPAADVFALGSVLVHAAKGKGPFDSDSPYIVAYQVVHDEADLTEVPDELAPIVGACLAKEPEKRPTPDELMAMLRSPDLSTLSFPAPVLMSVPGPVRGQAPVAVRAEPQEPRAGHFGEPLGEPEATHFPASGRAHVPTSVPAHVPSASVPSASVLGALRRPRTRWLAGGAALLVLAAGGAVTARQLPSDGTASPATSPSPSPSGKASAKAVRAWETGLSGVRGASPTAVRSAACAYSDTDEALFCVDKGVEAARVDAATGHEGWHRAGTAGEAGEPPVVSGGLVHVVSADGSRLKALDPATGDVRWSKKVSAYGGLRFYAGDTVLLVAGDGTVSALSSTTGTTRWRKRIPGHSQPVFTAFGGSGTGFAAYAQSVSRDGSHTVVSAVAMGSGTVRWQHTFTGSALPVGATDGILYLAQSNTAGATVAVLRYDPATGTQSRVALPYPVANAYTIVSGATVYVLGDNGSLIAVGRDSVSWQQETSVNHPTAPVVSDGRLYFGSGDGRLITVDLDGGEMLGQTPARLGKGRSGYLADQQAPIVAGRRVFSYTPNGTVFCTDVRTLVG